MRPGHARDGLAEHLDLPRDAWVGEAGGDADVLDDQLCVDYQPHELLVLADGRELVGRPVELDVAREAASVGLEEDRIEALDLVRLLAAALEADACVEDLERALLPAGDRRAPPDEQDQPYRLLSSRPEDRVLGTWCSNPLAEPAGWQDRRPSAIRARKEQVLAEPRRTQAR